MIEIINDHIKSAMPFNLCIFHLMSRIFNIRRVRIMRDRYVGFTVRKPCQELCDIFFAKRYSM